MAKYANIGDFFRTQKIGFEKCLDPTMQCKEPAVRAHSIQNCRIIDLLEENNHVLAWQPRASVDHIDISLRLIGRNDASTFTGFCNHHDSELFRRLDTKSIDGSDREQLFLLAYRGISCELHAVMSYAVRFQNLYELLKRAAPIPATRPAPQARWQQSRCCSPGRFGDTGTPITICHC